jgi:uncharacterized cupredoxin-like copper-binding protein
VKPQAGGGHNSNQKKHKDAMMILKLVTLAALAGAAAGCMPSQTGSLPSGTTLDAELQTGSLTLASAVETSPPTGAHLDAPGTAPHFHDEQQVYGQPADPKKAARVVRITMSETDDGEMIFAPNSVQARAGEQVRFKIRNAGQMEHEFVLATAEANQKHAIEMQKNPDMEHDDPNAVRLAPGRSGEIAWKFTNSGEFEFACLIPGHRESGMIGLAAVY